DADSSRAGTYAFQALLHRADRAGAGRDVAGQAPNTMLAIAALHDVGDAPHRFGFEKRAATDEEIILGQQPDEIEPELPGGGLDAKTHIRHAAGDIGGDGG